MSETSEMQQGDLVARLFKSRRYNHETDSSTSSMLLTLVMGCVAGAVSGLLAAVAGYYGLAFVLVTPLLIGAGIGAIIAKSTTLTKNRDPWGNASAAIAASLIAFTVNFAGEFFQFQHDIAAAVEPHELQAALQLKHFGKEPEKLSLTARRLRDQASPEYLACLQVQTFTEYVAFRIETGESIGEVGDDADQGLSLGFAGTLIFWLVNFLIISGVAIAVSWKAATCPFCVRCNKWMKRQRMATFAVDGKRVFQILEAGDLALLQNELPQGKQARVYVNRCDACASPNQAVIEVVSVKVINGNESEQTVGRLVPQDESVRLLSETVKQTDEALAVLNTAQDLSGQIQRYLKEVDSDVSTEVNQEIDEYMQKLLKEQREKRELASGG